MSSSYYDSSSSSGLTGSSSSSGCNNCPPTCVPPGDNNDPNFQDEPITICNHPEEPDGSGCNRNGGGDGGGSCPISGNPVRYHSGRIAMNPLDMKLSVGKISYVHQREYDNLAQFLVDGDNGFGWKTNPVPRTQHTGAYYHTVFSEGDTVYFNTVPDGQGIYRATGNFPETLRIDSVAQTYIVTRSDLTVWTFCNRTNDSVPQGLPQSAVAADGYGIEFLYEDQRLVKIRAFHQSQPTVTIVELVYAWNAGGRLASITRNRLMDGVLTPEKRILYSYHTGADAFGNAGDLQTITTQGFTENVWLTGETTYHRYYKVNDPQGMMHQLKMSFFPADFEDLADVFGRSGAMLIDDATALEFSTKFYVYDDRRRVILERAENNRKLITFEFTEYPDNSDRNAPHHKTVETGPFGEKNIVFTNFNGDVILREEVPPPGSSEASAIQYFVYNGSGKRTHEYSPKAILGYTITIGSTASLSVSVNPNEGQIDIHEFGDGINTPLGSVVRELIQRGSAGTPIVQSVTQFEKRQIENRIEWSVVKTVSYADENQTSPVESAQNAYQYHTDSLVVSQITTTLPIVSTADNGDNIAHTRVARFDENGREIWSKDELGIISYQEYEPIFGRRVKSIRDVNTTKTADFTVAVPSGWSTAGGAGKHLVSEFRYDPNGRLIETLGPKSTAVGPNNTAVLTRPVSWTVYDSARRQTRSASGFVTLDSNGSAVSETLVNPVKITIYDSSRNIVEAVTAKRESADGKLLLSDTFPQSSYLSWTKNVYDRGRLVAKREYFSVPLILQRKHLRPFTPTNCRQIDAAAGDSSAGTAAVTKLRQGVSVAVVGVDEKQVRQAAARREFRCRHARHLVKRYFRVFFESFCTCSCKK